MQFKIHFDAEVNPGLYRDYCMFLFDKVKESVSDLINPRKYKVREKAVIESSVMRWVVVPLELDLVYYVENCLELVKVKGEYVIRVRDDLRVRGSRTKVKTLIRLLEYGNEKIPSYPVIRRVLLY